jgi:hypothetical protein
MEKKIIGKLTTIPLKVKDNSGNIFILKPKEYNIVDTFIDKEHTFYVTNQWHKPNIPLIILDDIVEHYREI